MAAKGPRSEFGGLNVKTGQESHKEQTIDFGAFMQEIIKDSEEELILPEKKADAISEEEMRKITQEEIESFNQAKANNEEEAIAAAIPVEIIQSSDDVLVPVTPEPPHEEEPQKQEAPKQEEKILKTTHEKFGDIIPGVPFNQQPRPQKYEQKKITEINPNPEPENPVLNTVKEEIPPEEPEKELHEENPIEETPESVPEKIQEEIPEESQEIDNLSSRLAKYSDENTEDSSENISEKPSKKKGFGLKKKEKKPKKETPKNEEPKLSKKELKELKKQEKLAKKAGKKKEKTEANSQNEETSLNQDVKKEDSTKNAKKAKSRITPEKLAKKNFPKQYYDPTDMEIDEETGQPGYYFNIEKTLRKNNKLWITKIIPLNTLDRLTFDKKIFDDYAVLQHKRVEELNHASAEEQYMYETRNRMIKFLIGAVGVIIVILIILFKIIPDTNYSGALKSYNNQEWAAAYQEFSDLGNYKNSKYYGKYSEAMSQLSDGKYDEAKENFKLLLDYQKYFDTSIEDMVNECDYQKAISIYSNREFEEAMKIFATIPNYKEAKDYYYKCGYQIANEYYEDGDIPNAIDSFYKIKAYEDSNEILSQLANQFYEDGMNLYDSKKYDEAIEKFQFLAKYNFKDSKSMISQCYYRDGLNKYNSGDFTGARDSFGNILEYKDSNAMYKECTYRIARIKYAESIEESLKEYSEIPTYRDVPSILNQGVFVLYGEWNIVEMNGSKTTETTFKFNSGGLFQTLSNVLYTAISTEATPQPYTWNGEKYATADGAYTLSATAITNDEISLVCEHTDKNGTKTVTYTCERTKDFLTLLNTKDDTTDTETQTETEESKEETITNILQDYVDKKTDGKVVLNEKEFDALMIIQQKNDNLS